MRSARGGDQLLGRHLEAAVAVDGPDRLVGAADLGPDGGGDGEAHRAQAAGVHPGVGLLELPVLAGPHLVLADARGHDRALGGHVPQLLEDELGLEALALLGGLVGQRVLLLPAAEGGLPLGAVGLGGEAALGLQDLDQLLDDQAAVAHDRDVRAPDLAQLGGVDVDVDDLGVGGEAVELAGDPVVEAAAQGDEQVRLLHGGDRRVVAVHARHAEAQRVAVGEGAPGHQRGDHRQLAAARPAPGGPRRPGP